jgi:suppressor of tumorigenicity protein 14
MVVSKKWWCRLNVIAVTQITAIVIALVVVAPPASGGGGEATPEGDNGIIVRRSFPASVARQRLAMPTPPKPTPEELLLQLQYKIAGGKPALPGQFPWQVALVRSEGEDRFSAFFCGGSLISDRYVLTAAHCTYEDNPEGGAGLPMSAEVVSVLAGTTNFQGGILIKVKAVQRHDFNHQSYENDVAILELEKPLTPSNLIKPIPVIASSVDVYREGVGVQVSGWGATVSGPIPIELREKVTELQYLDDGVTVKDQQSCNARYLGDQRDRIYQAEIKKGRSSSQALAIRDKKAPATKVMVTDTMFCAGGNRDAGKDSCGGDSGGPLMAKVIDPTGQSVLVQAGIVSWGPTDGCGLIDYSGVYVKLTRFSDWINAKLTAN